jgi:hypothetical protein
VDTDTPVGKHEHPDMPEWGRVLWQRYWLLQAQVDHHASQLASLKEKNMAEQVDIDALTTAVQGIDTAVDTAVTTLTADDSALAAALAAFEQANPGVDISALQAALAQTATDVQTGLGAAVDNLTALVPAPAPAPVDPTPAPATD